MIASVYVEDHERLWSVAQVGYDQVRDGFTLGQGILGRSVRDGVTVYVPDVREDEHFIAALPNVVSELCVPITGRHCRAALNLETIAAELPEGTEEAVAPLVEGLAAIIDDVASAVSIDLTTMAHLCVHASSLRGIGPLAEFATRAMGRLLDLEAVQLDLGTRPTGPPASFWRRPASGLRPIAAERVGVALSSGLSDQTVVVADGTDIGLTEAGDAFRRILWVPLRSGDTLIGTLVGRSDGPIELDTERSDGAALFAQQMAALIDVAQALRREQRAAVTDSQTGLLNRRGFDERLGEELARAERAGASLAVVLVDCDDLKQINDTLGHESGDESLKAVARLIRDGKRMGDLAARIGGDEFGLACREPTSTPRWRCRSASDASSRPTALPAGRRRPASGSRSIRRTALRARRSCGPPTGRCTRRKSVARTGSPRPPEQVSADRARRRQPAAGLTSASRRSRNRRSGSLSVSTRAAR